MAIALGEQAADTHDPSYLEGMAHLQVGRWREAIACFEKLIGQYPGSAAIAQALDEARFKAGLDVGGGVRARRWVIPWRKVLFRLLVVLAVGFGSVEGIIFFRKQVVPALATAKANQLHAQLLAEGAAYLDVGDLAAAEASFKALLATAPDDSDTLAGLERVAVQRELVSNYQRAVSAQGAGRYDEAMAALTQISLLTPGYRDVSQRITAIKKQQDLGRLFGEAGADYQAGLWQDALLKYQQLREINTGYQAETVSSRLFELHLRLGRERITQRPPALGAVQQALDHFSRALSLQPRNAEAALEQRLARLYLEGQSRYQQGAWEEALGKLSTVYAQRPDYLGEGIVSMLYDAYVRNGDQYRDASDYYLAYEQYRKAHELPVADKALARGRMASVESKLTPTPTPSPTPTASATPLPTPTRGPTTVPTPKPLQLYRGQIVFFSETEEQLGLWVMDADGQNRQYLGNSRDLRKQYDVLIEQAQRSPDGRYRLFVRDARPTAQIFIERPPHEVYGDLGPLQLTRLSGLSYDPVWSPDGGRVAFVSQENRSDDIWIINADGSDATLVTRNSWEWDKHPSWSPDSRRLVFWSNREGRRQIYVMDADGRNVRNISNTEWEEYNPIWVR